MSTLVIVRHGQSVWNLENRFTGWRDVDLTEQGEEEAKQAGIKLKQYKFSEAFTSVLIRAIHTLEIILKEIDQTGIPVTRNKALNERNYGDLQGLNKEETRKQFGDEQLNLWRRSFTITPPHGESLQDTVLRVIPFYETEIKPKLNKGETILITAHGNSLRALMMHLETLSPAQIEQTEIATGIPRVYTFNEQFALTHVNNL